MTETKISYKNIESIEEGNKLIRNFMKDGTNEADISFYSSDWNMLMPVIEKIESQVFFIKIYFEKGWGTEVKINLKGEVKPFIRVYEKGSKIEAVWMAAVKYIKIYNKIK